MFFRLFVLIRKITIAPLKNGKGTTACSFKENNHCYEGTLTAVLLEQSPDPQALQNNTAIYW